MSREPRKGYYNRDWERNRDRDRERDRDRDRDRPDYRSRSRPPLRKRSRSPLNRREESKRSRSPRKHDKDVIDENILSEISKLPEPSELWDSQFQEGGFPAPPPPSFSQQPPEVMPSSRYNTNHPPSYSGLYDDFPPVASHPQPPLPPDITTWNQMSLPPPPTQPPPNMQPAPFHNNVEDQIKKEAAIESEMRHQKAALSKQREDYVKKANILKKELDTLKDQRNELRGDAKRSPSPDTKRFLKENTKLQLEIQNKLKTIYNVVDMLNGIIGEEAPEIHDSDDSAERSSKRKSRSPSASKKSNYIYYDPEMHWCRVCNEFPPTAKDYLNHLHSPAHHKMAAAHLEAPWHSISGANEGFPSYPSAPTKRTPIKGLQFFVPSTAWYCKLCDQFIGDLHCASAHLKSITHSKNYTNFVEQNPHWETDWMSDRQKAFEKSRANKSKAESEKPQQYMAHTITFNKDGFHTKRKDSPSAESKKKKDKKKKSKRKMSSSSSSSSNSSSSDSDSTKKKSKDKKQKSRFDARDDKTLSEWVSNIQMDRLNDSDRKLLDTLKHRMKKDENEKRRSADRERDRAARDRERLAELQKRLRESERRESRSREDRDRRRDDRDRDSREESSSSSRPDTKKPSTEVKKMPFIGKMPVYKNLTKNSKTEDQKKDDLKKKEEEEVTKKRREEMDAEIQKKVAEFKEKIARAQLEREQAQAEQQAPLVPPPGAVGPPAGLGVGPNLGAGPNPGAGLLPNPYLPPPAVATPTALAPAPPRAPALPAQATPSQTLPPQPTLPKDFQEALDIIFPSEVKNPDLSQQDLFAMPPGFMPGLAGVMPPFPGLPLMNPQMFGFDLNAPLFQPRPQLYDTHVPIVPNPKPRPKRPQQQKNDVKKKQEAKKEPVVNKNDKKNGDMLKKKEEMDDLAMLGIDASDVGAGI